MGGGGFGPSPLFTFFFTFNVNPFLGGVVGGFQVSWTKSIQMFFFLFFFNFPKRYNHFYPLNITHFIQLKFTGSCSCSENFGGLSCNVGDFVSVLLLELSNDRLDLVKVL